MVPSERVKILEKLQKYCIYQDRCHQEVRNKLLKMKVYGADLEDLMMELVQDNFLNEERFARSYARGKYKIKRWGKMRIQQELRQRQISDYCIRKAMEEIEEDVYEKNAQAVFKELKNGYRRLPFFEARKKVTQAMIRRGYEYDIIQSLVGRWTEADGNGDLESI